MDQKLMIQAAQRLTNVRSEILSEQAFLGRLIIKMPFAFAECGTACTDMNSILFDPSFVYEISDTELKFILLHELMHCVLKHCTRGRGKIDMIYNIACDIVVNSIILEAMGLDDIIIRSSPAMHTAPDGSEGRLHSAEEVYDMLLASADGESGGGSMTSGFGGADGGDGSSGGTVDSHEQWKSIECTDMAETIWNKNVVDAGKRSGSGKAIPETIRRVLIDIKREPKIDWRIVLREFIQHDRGGYTFTPPDKKLLHLDTILPEFNPDVYGTKAENLWFLIDTSGSVNNQGIAEAMGEVKDAMEQIGNMAGKISFFDHRIYDPIPFESVEELMRVKPVGGGGTSFMRIFTYLKNNLDQLDPRAIIIITDGYADFPDEDAALGIPVIWVIIDSGVEAPFGERVHIYTKK